MFINRGRIGHEENAEKDWKIKCFFFKKKNTR
jgi:hypothetical protein